VTRAPPKATPVQSDAGPLRQSAHVRWPTSLKRKQSSVGIAPGVRPCFGQDYDLVVRCSRRTRQGYFACQPNPVRRYGIPISHNRMHPAQPLTITGTSE